VVPFYPNSLPTRGARPGAGEGGTKALQTPGGSWRGGSPSEDARGLMPSNRAQAPPAFAPPDQGWADKEPVGPSRWRLEHGGEPARWPWGRDWRNASSRTEAEGEKGRLVAGRPTIASLGGRGARPGVATMEGPSDPWAGLNLGGSGA